MMVPMEHNEKKWSKFLHRMKSTLCIFFKLGLFLVILFEELRFNLIGGGYIVL